MITKSGVLANKVVVGLALYGRTFQMTTPGCYGPDCTFTGPASGATPGRCTGTAGYLSNFEIGEIIAADINVQRVSDADGDVLVYNNTQWVSFLTKPSYSRRTTWISGLNFGGTSAWAVDLDKNYDVGSV